MVKATALRMQAKRKDDDAGRVAGVCVQDDGPGAAETTVEGKHPGVDAEGILVRDPNQRSQSPAPDEGVSARRQGFRPLGVAQQPDRTDGKSTGVEHPLARQAQIDSSYPRQKAVIDGFEPTFEVKRDRRGAVAW
jgi:hypothetical protein